MWSYAGCKCSHVHCDVLTLNSQCSVVCCSKNRTQSGHGPEQMKVIMPKLLGKDKLCTLVNCPISLLNSKMKILMRALAHDSTLNIILDKLCVAASETCWTGWGQMLSAEPGSWVGMWRGGYWIMFS